MAPSPKLQVTVNGPGTAIVTVKSVGFPSEVGLLFVTRISSAGRPAEPEPRDWAEAAYRLMNTKDSAHRHAPRQMAERRKFKQRILSPSRGPASSADHPSILVHRNIINPHSASKNNHFAEFQEAKATSCSKMGSYFFLDQIYYSTAESMCIFRSIDGDRYFFHKGFIINMKMIASIGR